MANAIADPVAVPSPDGTISLWWCSLAPPREWRDLLAWLSPDECRRMERFGSATMRVRYLIGRASLRRLLGRALGVAPVDVALERGPRGRPQLGGQQHLDFNVSHTGDVALIAISREGRIGVDLERSDRAINSTGVARKFLTARERESFASWDPDAARRRILRLWTCKEALSKATGDALSAPMARLDIDVEPALRLAAGPAPYLPAHFALFAARVPDDHIATVALWRPRNATEPATPETQHR
jgi:4'-phosphopantetheinyl transferase